MKNKDIWVVTIDFTKMDNQVFKYLSFLCGYIKPSKVHFIHVVKTTKNFDYIPQDLQDLTEQIIVDCRLNLDHKVETRFKSTGIPYECHVVEGMPFQEVIHLVTSVKGTMVIAGRKKVSSASGIVSERLSRNLPCDFLLIPETFELRLKTIQLMSDFSNHATLAMQKAISIKTHVDGSKILAHHIYKVPMGWSKSGKSFEDIKEIMKTNSEKEMRRWLTRFKEKADIILTHDQDEPIGKLIMDEARKNHTDLIVIGSKGQSAASLALLGSNTMKLLKANETIPMLIVKKEGENLRLIDAIREL